MSEFKEDTHPKNLREEAIYKIIQAVFIIKRTTATNWAKVRDMG